jgi:hypothetical protein
VLGAALRGLEPFGFRESMLRSERRSLGGPLGRRWPSGAWPGSPSQRGVMGVPDDPEQLKRLYLPPTDEFVLVDVPVMQFLMIEGEGDHETQEFAAATKWLYAALHPIRRIAKERMGKRFVEPPLEVLWWADDMADFIAGNRAMFKWRQMIVTADWVSATMLDDAVASAAPRLGARPTTLRLEPYDEGRCVQIMHIGVESSAVPTMARLHNEFLPAHDLVAIGRHHEIYLSDAQRVAPEKMRTVLRQPVRSRSSRASGPVTTELQ